MELNASNQNHAKVLAVSEGVPEAHPRDFGVTEAALKFFKNFVQQVAATAPMAKKKDTPKNTTQRELRRSRRFHKLDAAILPPPSAVVAAPEINTPRR